MNGGVLDEVLDAPAVGDDSLTQMDQPCCSFSNNVNAEQLRAFAVEDQFESSLHIAHNLGARGLSIKGMYDFIWNTLFGQRFL